MTKVGDFEFKSEWEAKKANFFRKAGSNVLFALAVDYPELREIPLVYLDLARRELKRIGLKHFKNVYGKTPVPSYRVFYLGPRPHRYSSTTPKSTARSFRIYLYDVRDAIEEAN